MKQRAVRVAVAVAAGLMAAGAGAADLEQVYRDALSYDAALAGARGGLRAANGAAGGVIQPHSTTRNRMSDDRHLFTSESVGPGHPDKVCDQISDSILDAILAQDPTARVACETLCTTGLVLVAGEITTKAVVDYNDVVRKAVREVGYTDPHDTRITVALIGAGEFFG